MFPSALVMGALMPLSGTLYDKFGAKPVVIPGLIILALATFKLSTAISMNSSKESIIFINCIRSIGLGIAMMPISTAGMNVVKGEMIPRASALNSTIRQVASSLAVTIMTVIIQSKTSYNYSKLAEQINIYNKTAVGTINSLTKSYMYEGFSQETSKVMALSQLAKIIQGQASVDAMAYSISVTGAIAVIAIFLTLFMRTRRWYKKLNYNRGMCYLIIDIYKLKRYKNNIKFY